MEFFNCSANGPAATGTECEKSCNTLDMACVSRLLFNIKIHMQKQILYGSKFKANI